ncbi:MAG: ATP synthase F1 subunit gamma [Desulfobacteraceae bacterium]|nr:ATP synthase F1 subunit gamma [Desulfobacteraceae bacterium]MCF8094031.1 ATP synthase F1 subunit gamma [Desulfobacteraceae bacterium]
MASLKEVKSKINGVKKTKQITRAMNMVASSKLRGAQAAMTAFHPYAEKFAEVLGNIAGRTGDETSPLLVAREEVKNIHVVLLTSDRGLCGGFNTKLIETAEEFIQDKIKTGIDISFTNFGKKGRDWCRKEKLTRVDEYLGVVGGKFGFNVASAAAQKLINGFLDEEYDEVHIVFSRFLSMASQPPVVQQLLPVPVTEAAGKIQEEEKEEKKGYMPEHICEPSPEELLNAMLPRNVAIQLYNALLETSTSEHASRMRAMDNATKACDDMIESLTLAYNKARQQAITMELMDIVGGAEALRG